MTPSRGYFRFSPWGETQRGVFHSEVKNVKSDCNRSFLFFLKFSQMPVILFNINGDTWSRLISLVILKINWCINAFIFQHVLRDCYEISRRNWRIYFFLYQGKIFKHPPAGGRFKILTLGKGKRKSQNDELFHNNPIVAYRKLRILLFITQVSEDVTSWKTGYFFVKK